MSDSDVNIGWFDPASIIPDPLRFVTRTRATIGPAKGAWPIRCIPIEGTGLFYNRIDGYVPIHIDSEDPAKISTRMFHFVFHAENRPILLLGEAGDPTMELGSSPNPRTQMAIHRSKKILFGADEHDPYAAFQMGAVELKPGMAIHFDVSKVFHGIAAGPLPMDVIGARRDPQLLIIQMAGFGRHEISAAANNMSALLNTDRPYWDAGSSARSRRKSL